MNQLREINNREFLQELKYRVKQDQINPKELTELLTKKVEPQKKTLELCPKCGEICNLAATDYRNIRCWKITCQGCNYLSFASEQKK